MRNGVAERGFLFRPFRIDMDELVILDHVGIDVDPVLIDQVPGRHADLLADHGPIGLKRDRRLLPDFIHFD